MIKTTTIITIGLFVFIIQSLYAQNPLIMDQFTADPTARVFDGKVYVYPSHDIPCEEGQGFIGFCMADYHVFSSENLIDWKDHGVVLTQNDVHWAEQNSFSMWAPDCIFKGGKYYFYYPVIEKGKREERGRAIGVAISDKPYGPFIPEKHSIKGLSGIDPNPFIDKDGIAYLYWANKSELYVAKLSEDMKHIITEPRLIHQLPDGFKEGPFIFERKGIYYFTFPYIWNKTEGLAYATGDNPLGPFTYRGLIMDESPIGCWTNHQSIVEYKNQWYLFYHHNDLSPEFDKNRSIKADYLFFNDDGTILKVRPTLRGVGINKANNKIQIDRYSNCSESGVGINFIDESNKMDGWKLILNNKDSWIKYNGIDFESLKLSYVEIKSISTTGGTITIRADKKNGFILAKVRIPKSNNWNNTHSSLLDLPKGIHDIFIILDTETEVELDWISFK